MLKYTNKSMTLLFAQEFANIYIAQIILLY